MRDIHSKTMPAAIRPAIGQLAAIAALVGTVCATNDALAQSSYPSKVQADCANFGGLAAAVTPVSCSTCHTGYSSPLNTTTGTAAGLAFQSSGDTATVANGWCAGVTTPTPTPVNHAPTVSTAYTGGVAEPNAVNFKVTPADADGDTVTVQASGDINGTPASSYYDDTTHTFNWAPSVAGSYAVTFTPTDSKGLAGAATTVNITVDPGSASSPNNAPQLTKPTVMTYTATVGTAVSIPVAATDQDGDSVTLNYTGPTSGSIPATYDPSTNEWAGTFSWTPTSATPSSVTFTFAATDDPADPTVAAKTSASKTVTINVTSPTGGTGDAGVISGLNTTRATWSARTKTLNVAGTADGTKIAGQLVTLTTDGGATTTAKVSRRKTWSKRWRLSASPCTVTASAGSVSTAPYAVARAPIACTDPVGGSDDHDADDDDRSSSTATSSKKRRKSDD